MNFEGNLIRDNFILILLVISVCIFIILAVTIFIKSRKKKPFNVNDLEGHDFEEFCADLLFQHGFSKVEVTKGSGDFGADILAEKDMVTYAIQCKVYSAPVGVKAVQEANAGRDYYDRMVGAVLTNQYFTAPAKEAASKLKIILWDGDYLQKLIDSSEI